MQTIKAALEELEEIYQGVMGRSAPDLHIAECFPFPPGVDPIEYALMEADQLRRIPARERRAAPVPTWIPYADSFVKPDEFIARLEVPGIPREDLQVSMVGNECVVRGERKPPEKEMSPLALERPWGPFERRFTLPPGTRQEDIQARSLNGILELRIPIRKSDEEKTRIEVK